MLCVRGGLLGAEVVGGGARGSGVEKDGYLSNEKRAILLRRRRRGFCIEKSYSKTQTMSGPRKTNMQKAGEEKGEKMRKIQMKSRELGPSTRQKL